MEDGQEIFGTEIVEHGKLGRSCFFLVKDILFIDVWQPKKNYLVPRFHTRTGIYTVTLTLESLKGLPSLTELYRGILVNLSEIDYIEDTKFDIVVHFKNSNLTTSMARNKLKYYRHLLKKDET